MSSHEYKLQVVKFIHKCDGKLHNTDALSTDFERYLLNGLMVAVQNNK